MSHDLRNPLHTILGCVDVVRSCRLSLGEDCLAAVEFIDKASHRIADVIADLLVLSRIAGQEILRKPVDLSAVALAFFNELKQSDPRRTIRFSVAQGLTARAEPGLVRILLENLIRNSWKFTSKKDVAEIELGIHCDNGAQTYFVRDNGVGFDMDLSDKLFKPSARLHSDKEFKGTGIGLSIVKRIAEKHGGAVWAESEKDKGTTIYFRLA